MDKTDRLEYLDIYMDKLY